MLGHVESITGTMVFVACSSQANVGATGQVTKRMMSGKVDWRDPNFRPAGAEPEPHPEPVMKLVTEQTLLNAGS